MKLFEHEAKEIFRAVGMPTPPGGAAKTPEEASSHVERHIPNFNPDPKINEAEEISRKQLIQSSTEQYRKLMRQAEGETPLERISRFFKLPALMKRRKKE